MGCDSFRVTKCPRTAVRIRLMNRYPDSLHVQKHTSVVMKGLNFKSTFSFIIKLSNRSINKELIITALQNKNNQSPLINYIV